MNANQFHLAKLISDILRSDQEVDSLNCMYSENKIDAVMWNGEVIHIEIK